MSLLTERLLNAQYHNHEEDCCCGEECCCHDHEEKEIEQQLSEEEIEKIIEEKYSEKDEKTKEFIRKGLRKFGDRFDYSKTEYVRSKDKVIITCLKEGHGDFNIQPSNFLMRGRCQKCGEEEYSKNRRYNNIIFIEKAKEVHGDKYDYSKVNYIDSTTPVTIICPIHGEFKQTPSGHLSRCGCPYCNGGVKIDTEEFIRRAKEVHGDKYDYSKVNYIDSTTPVTIICPIHGEFEQSPVYHLEGKGCQKCAGNHRYTNEEFIEAARKVHGDKYDYSKVNYINANTAVTIICPVHGEFEQAPTDHLSGKGCLKCGLESISNKLRSTTERFIEQARKIHGDKYDYSKVNYINNSTPVIIICPIHGEFEQVPYNHLGKAGCPKCSNNVKLTIGEFISRANDVHGEGTYLYNKVNYINLYTPVEIYDPIYNEYFIQTPANHLRGHGNPNRQMSFGERQVYWWLRENNIEFKREVWLEDTFGRHGNKIRVDFLIPLYKSKQMIIEYNGIQHYKWNQRFQKTYAEFENQKRRDQELREYCSINSIKLIEVPYIIHSHFEISDFLTKTVMNGIDLHTLVDIDSLYILGNNYNST